MRGIGIHYTGGYGAIYKSLFKNIPWKEYDWYASDSEIIQSNRNICLPERLSLPKFSSLLDEENYLVIFSKIEGLKKGGRHIPIKTYEQFLNSDCEIMLLVTDSMYINIYAKEQNLILQFLNNAETLTCECIEVLTDKTDWRTEMRAF